MDRFLLDNDSSNFISRFSLEDIETTVEEVVRECPPNVTTTLLCSGAGTCYWPTTIGHVDPRAHGLIAAHAKCIDPFGNLLQRMKDAGKETFITYRMNDVHNPMDADQWNTPRIRRENPECIVGLDEVREDRAEWMSYCLDYTREDVQRYVLGLIQEQVTLYGHIIDGFQMDWMRFPRHLSGTPEKVWEKREIITDFIAQVRAILDNAGRKILLGSRVPSTPAGCRRLGFDLEAWSNRDLVDFLVACPFLTTDWYIPISDFRVLLGDKGIPVYAGFDLSFGKQNHCPESLRGICTNLYDSGADGIYVFNFPCWREYLAARPYHWLTGLETPKTAAAKPLLLAVNNKRHRITGVDQEAQIPGILTAGNRLTLSLHIALAALPAWRVMCLVHSHGDVTLDINGRSEPRDSVNRSEIFLEFVDQYHLKDARPKPEDCRIFRIDPAHLHPGQNQIVLTNSGAVDIEIERVNLALW